MCIKNSNLQGSLQENSGIFYLVQKIILTYIVGFSLTNVKQILSAFSFVLYLSVGGFLAA